MVGKSAGELEDRGLGGVAIEQGRGGLPADFDAAEQIGLGAGELVKPAGTKARVFTEDLRVGQETDGGAAAVGSGADLFQLGHRVAARKTLGKDFAIARDLDTHIRRQGVDHRYADAMQAARRGIGLAGKFAARMQHGHDDFERRFVRKARVRVDRDATAIVADRQAAISFQRHFDAAGMAGDGLVHAVVEHFGGEVMEGAFVGAPDIHARAASDGLQPLQHFDMAGIVIVGGRSSGEQIAHATVIGGGARLEQWANGARKKMPAGVNLLLQYFVLQCTTVGPIWRSSPRID